jgi:hypothetical protein
MEEETRGGTYTEREEREKSQKPVHTGGRLLNSLAWVTADRTRIQNVEEEVWIMRARRMSSRQSDL